MGHVARVLWDMLQGVHGTCCKAPWDMLRGFHGTCCEGFMGHVARAP